MKNGWQKFIMRIAMWSGPRNLSTAMMYSFGSRQDFAVWDEPYYAAYLAVTGLKHPMGDAIIAAGDVCAKRVSERCIGLVPAGKPHFYQKHMTHHMVEGFDRGWMNNVVNVFLIRHPARVVASYAAKRENPTLDDIGFRQQAELYDEVRDMGGTPLVIDSHDIRENPKGMLSKLCEVIGLNFDPAMLSWPAGGHREDGVWAKHWYGAVHRSTGFAGAEGRLPRLSPDYEAVAQEAMPFYEKLSLKKLSL
jgi:Sulfotransferase domain